MSNIKFYLTLHYVRKEVLPAWDKGCATVVEFLKIIYLLATKDLLKFMHVGGELCGVQLAITVWGDLGETEQKIKYKGSPCQHSE